MLLDLVIKFREVYFQLLPVALADEVPDRLHFSPVQKFRSTVERALKATHQEVASKSKFELGNMVDLVSYVNCSFQKEMNLIDTLQFIEQDLIGLELDWL